MRPDAIVNVEVINRSALLHACSKGLARILPFTVLAGPPTVKFEAKRLGGLQIDGSQLKAFQLDKHRPRTGVF